MSNSSTIDPVKIGDRLVGPEHPAYVIAEIGFNHGGSIDLAKEMIDAAAGAGADAVKFQSYHADRLVLKGNPYLDVFIGGELSRDDHGTLADCARANRVDFLSTPFDDECVGWLEDVGSPAIKIASMDLTNDALLARTAKSGLPIILSTGMGSAEEIEGALRVLDDSGVAGVVLLHCISEYPAEENDANVATVRDMAERFRRPAGYSDHVIGPIAAATAVAVGACVVEKHFTTDKNLPGPDHAISADPQELHEMIRMIRAVETVRGNTVFESERPDRKNAPLLRRGVYAARALSAGTELTADDLKTVRPEGGSAVGNMAAMIGRRTGRDIGEDEAVALDALE